MAPARMLPGPTAKRVPQTVVRPAETGQRVTTQVPRPEAAATPPEACQPPATKVDARGPAQPTEKCQASWVQNPGALTAAPAGEIQPPIAQLTAATHVMQAVRARAQVPKPRIVAVEVIGDREGGRDGVEARCCFCWIEDVIGREGLERND